MMGLLPDEVIMLQDDNEKRKKLPKLIKNKRKIQEWKKNITIKTQVRQALNRRHIDVRL